MIAASVLLVGGGFSVVAFGATSTASGCSAATRTHGHGSDAVRLSSAQDVDDDGTTDLVIGSPGASASAGAVDIRYAFDARHIDATGLRTRTTRLHESSFSGLPQHAGDAFGASSAFLHANSDHCGDLAFGAPGADGSRGRVVVAFGSPSGLATKRTITIAGRTKGERFGSGVVAQGKDLWIAAPGRAVSGARGAGAVDHYRTSGSRAVRVQTLDATSPGVAGSPRAGGGFGSSLGLGGGTLVVGEPGADVSGATDAGAIVVVRAAAAAHIAPLTITRNTAGVSGAAAAGDRFGAAVSADDGEPQSRTDLDPDVVVVAGAPGATVGGKRAAGAAYVFRVPPHGRWVQYAQLTQDSPGVPAASQRGARLGAAVYVGGFSVRDDEYGDQNIALGAPGADVGAQRGAGLVDTFATDPQGEHPVKALSTVLHRGPGGRLGGVARAGDALGSGLSAVAFTDEKGGDYRAVGGAYLTIAVPGDDTTATDAGAVTLAVVTIDTEAPHRAPITVHGSGGGARYGAAAATLGNGSYDLTS